MNKKKKRTKKIGKPNRFLYAIIYRVLKRKYQKKYNLTFDNGVVRDIKGPAVVIATHTSDQDHILSALTLYPVRPTYIVSEHFMTGVTMDKLYTILHEIEGAYRFSFFNKSGVIREDIAKDGIIDPSRIENLYKFAVSVTGDEADFVAARDRITEIMEDCVAVRSYANYIEMTSCLRLKCFLARPPD